MSKVINWVVIASIIAVLAGSIYLGLTHTPEELTRFLTYGGWW